MIHSSFIFISSYLEYKKTRNIIKKMSSIVHYPIRFHIEDNMKNRYPVYSDLWKDYLQYSFQHGNYQFLSEDEVDDLKPNQTVYIENRDEIFVVKITFIEVDEDKFDKPYFDRLVVGYVKSIKFDRPYRNGYVTFLVRNIMEIKK